MTTPYQSWETPQFGDRVVAVHPDGGVRSGAVQPGGTGDTVMVRFDNDFGPDKEVPKSSVSREN
jgi:phage baseplate assembly protein gpV